MMSNDEIFFLCVLAGAEEMLGIKNPVEECDEQGVKAKWEEVSERLYEKGIIYNSEAGEIKISDEYLKMAVAISFPDIAFECPLSEDDLKCLFIKGALYVQLVHKEDECELTMYDRNEFIKLLSSEFMLSVCESNICIEMSQAELNEIVEKYLEGKFEQELEELAGSTINTDELRLVIDAFVKNSDFKDFVGYRNNQEEPSQAIYKSIKTEEGTILFKISNDKVKIIRCDVKKALSEVLNF